MYSLSGGMGSGFSSKMMMRYREEHPSKVNVVNLVMPSEKINDCMLTPYNVVLGMHCVVENSDLVLTYENKTMAD